jgi:V/A-type H+-transporting ATPase subunit A
MERKSESKGGRIRRVSGPVVIAEGIEARMNDLMRVGSERLMGEVIQINPDNITIQVYEDTSGVKPGEPVENTGQPLIAELGPGLLTSIYDGIQRPLPVLKGMMGDFIKRGARAEGLDRKRKWKFKPSVKKGDDVKEGQIIGTVKETAVIEHKVMVPPGVSGKIKDIKEGEFTVDETIATLANGRKLSMMQAWPVRKPRPVRDKLTPEIPLITGQRILDSLFPLAKGGAGGIPGPFGSGKCITGETQILIHGSLKPIRDVFEHAHENNAENISNDDDETIVKLSKPLEIFTFDGKVIKKGMATHIFRGKTTKLVEVRTRSGRKVRLTPIHKLFRLDENLNIVETEAMNLKEGDYIISPRLTENEGEYSKIYAGESWRVADANIIEKIPEAVDVCCKDMGITKKELSRKLGVPYHTLLNFYSRRNKPTVEFARKLFEAAGKDAEISMVKTERRSKTIKMPRYLSEDMAELVGYLMSDGMIKGSTVHFFNKKSELRERVSYLVKSIFGLDTKEYWARTVEAVRVSSQPIVNLLVNLGFPQKQKSRNVRLPEGLLNSPKPVIESFLKAYISCDGHVGERDVEITTASKRMQEGLSYLLLRLGILYRTREKIVNERTYYRLFISPREAIKLHPYYNKREFFNSTDVVPITSTLFKKLLGGMKPWNLEKHGIPTTAYYSNSRQTVKTFQSMASFLGSGEISSLAEALDYVFCDEITEIKTLEGPEDVYDITVPESHNFVGGDIPMILHNTVTQQQLAKWSDADIVVYVGCGERGNEMTEVLKDFPKLIDPKSGKPLMERTVLIANTSNMPVAAREASIYTGITIAEYYRDMGYDVALMADSTSRWAEAMREISSRLEEMPGEEGYPAYLSARLADFYERAGRVKPLGVNRIGSVSVIGAVSPPGGDLSEPVTQSTLRVVKTFWALDAKLAQRRHFPSINWLNSYSLYEEILGPWYAKNVAADWKSVINEFKKILQEEDKLQEIVQLVGSDALPESEQLTLEIARMIREFFLQQSAYHEVDTYCSLKKSYMMMKAILHYAEKARSALKSGVLMRSLLAVKAKNRIADAKFEKDHERILAEAQKAIDQEIDAMVKELR